MNTIYWLINAYELDTDYNHTVDFNSHNEQLSYFREKTIFLLDDSMYQRKNENVIIVDKSLNELKNCNYLIAINEDNTKYFYFIMDKNYNNDYSTSLNLKLDLIQTYLFDIQFSDGLIDRQHVKRWEDTEWGKKPTNEIQEEGLEVGEYEIKKIHTLYDYSDKGTYIFTSSDMLGLSNDKRPSTDSSSGGGDGGSGTNSENFKNGYLDENGLVFLKSKEGFASTPYQDIYGYWTTGYGITQAFQETYYNKLVPSCTEQQASEVMGEVVYNFSSQVKNLMDSIGYTNLNQNKLNALTSYAYQKGIGGLQNSTIYTYLAEGRSDQEIANIWTDDEFNTRRSEESLIFLSGIYPSMKISDVDNGGYVTDNNGKGYIPSNYK